MGEVRSDFHTHTKYCDGRSSVREMADAAYRLGFRALGFSGHGYTVFDDSYCMSEAETADYIRDVRAVAEEYRGRMDVMLGVERDVFAPLDTSAFDYVIGSCHYIRIGERYLATDNGAGELAAIMNEGFGGSFTAMARCYYEGVVGAAARFAEADIIGHVDIITKYIEKLGIEPDAGYYDAAIGAVERLARLGIPFEINVGAITRGHRTVPYPAARILCRIRELGGRIIIGGDCHAAASLGQNLDTGLALARSCGFTSRVELTPDGMIELPIS